MKSKRKIFLVLFLFLLVLMNSKILSQDFSIELNVGKVLRNDDYHVGGKLSLASKYFINDFVGVGADFGIYSVEIKNDYFLRYASGILVSEGFIVGRLNLKYLNLISTFGYGYYKFIEIESEFVRFPDQNTRRLAQSINSTWNVSYSIGIESFVFSCLKLGVNLKSVPLRATISSTLRNETTNVVITTKKRVELPFNLLEFMIGLRL